MATTYEVKDGKWRDIGAYALGAVEVAANSHASPEVREFAQAQLDSWVRQGFIEETIFTGGAK